MFRPEAEATFSGQVAPALEALLGPSQLFDTGGRFPEPISDAERILREKCSLYAVADSQGVTVPPVVPAKRKRGKKESATAGPMWFNLPAPELTPEVKADLEAVQLRRYINPKVFYKKKDVDQLPKYFQIGTVLPSPDEPRSLQVPKACKRKSLVEQLLMEDEEKQFSHRKLHSIQSSQSRTRYRGPKAPKKRRLGMSR